MQEAGESQDGIWKIAKWAKNRAQGQQHQATIPTLQRGAQVAQSLKAKAEMLREAHFPPPPEADLSDTYNFRYSASVTQDPTITIEETQQAALSTKKDKAPGLDGIPNRVIHIIARETPTLLQRLFQACLDLGVHPSHFKKATTVIIRKPGKANYSNPSAYRPIALLNTLGKTLEAVISNRIRFLAEEHALLPDTQMGARALRSTDTALQLVTEKIHAVWGGNTKRVASLLSLDVAGAFDRVSHARLLHNLKKRKIPERIINWVQDFLSDRSTEIRVGEYTLPESKVFAGIPQGSPISPVLYLFYNADLLDACNDLRLRTSPIGFVDDINILTYSTSTEENCAKLEHIHNACETWARRHGSKFAPEKYELIHFTRAAKRFNMTASVRIGSNTIKASQDIRMLGVRLDPQLRWHAHMRSIKAKSANHITALKTITGSTWGASVQAGIRVYTTAVRPALLHGCNAWYTPEGLQGANKCNRRTLQTIQGQCLRVITGAYKATSTEALEIETNIPPLDLYAEERTANIIVRLKSTRALSIDGTQV
jgi:hypothetical protein